MPSVKSRERSCRREFALRGVALNLVMSMADVCFPRQRFMDRMTAKGQALPVRAHWLVVGCAFDSCRSMRLCIRPPTSFQQGPAPSSRRNYGRLPMTCAQHETESKLEGARVPACSRERPVGRSGAPG